MMTLYLSRSARPPTNALEGAIIQNISWKSHQKDSWHVMFRLVGRTTFCITVLSVRNMELLYHSALCFQEMDALLVKFLTVGPGLKRSLIQVYAVQITRRHYTA